MKASSLRHLINLWPPFLFSGIKSTRISADFRDAEVRLHPRWYNRNYVGTHFGGSLFAMTDPWYMLLLMHQLGRDYVVWDQRASIEFISPGRGTVKASFQVNAEKLAEIIEKTRDGNKYLSVFQTDVTDESARLVARVEKTIYIRRKLLKNRTEDAEDGE
jgi:acyl-coenzyme A thioesterase PaaI-like protein